MDDHHLPLLVRRLPWFPASGRRTHTYTRTFSLASLRKSIGLTALFFFLTITFLVLAVGEHDRLGSLTLNMADMALYSRTADYQRSDALGKTGGVFGVITALIAYYCGLAELLTEDDLFTLPLGKYASKMV
jgi:uncharacterized protein